ncbi:MAG: sulfatase-like hydrolase/transferase [Phycisphaerae bacterium]
MQRPNLLFVFTDEQRYDTMAAYGNDRIQTPVLSRLAESATVFDRAYVTQPVCTPSRSTLMTGLYPHANGCTENNVPLQDDTPCLPEMLPPGEYVTGYHGKWHLGDEIFPQHGFEDWVSIDDCYRGYYREGLDRDARSTYHHWLVAHGREPGPENTFGRHAITSLPEEMSKPAFLAETASDFIVRNADRPWCLAVNFFEPHMPFTGPRNGQYDPAEVPLPENFDCPPTEDQPLKARLFSETYRRDGFEGIDLDCEDGWRTIRARYWGLCSLVDTHLGRILATLERTGQADNTIIVYTSDHGDMMGSHRLLAKCVQFEEAIRVPLIVKLPGQTEGRRVEGPVSQVDLMPTLLELMGVEPPSHLQGCSLRNSLRSGEPSGRDVVVEWNGNNNGFGDRIGEVAIRDSMRTLADEEQIVSAIRDEVRTLLSPDGWKLNVSPRGEHELYDLSDDPQEKQNLAADPACRQRMNDMLGRIKQWQRETGDSANLPASL